MSCAHLQNHVAVRFHDWKPSTNGGCHAFLHEADFIDLGCLCNVVECFQVGLCGPCRNGDYNVCGSAQLSFHQKRAQHRGGQIWVANDPLLNWECEFPAVVP